MGQTGRFAVSIVLASALAIAAMVGAIAARNQAALPVSELLRVEEFDPDDPQPIDEPFRFVLDVLGGERLMTDDDIARRFPPGTLDAGITGDSINAANDVYFAGVGGTLGLVRVKDREPRAISAVAVSESGTPIDVAISIDGNGHFASLGWDPDQAPTARLAAWEATLLLLAGWLLIAAAALAWRKGAGGRCWTLLGAALVTLASVLVLGDESLAYTAGRAVPALVVPFAAVLVTGRVRSGPRRWIAAIAAAAAVAGFVAPFTRSAALLGHPEIVGALTDSETIYRVLLVVAATLTALAMGGAAVANLATMRRSAGSQRPSLMVAATIASLWAVAGLGSAIDYGLASGVVASGPLTALGWSAMALVPGAAVIGLVSGDRLVPSSGPFAVALVLAVAVALGSLAGTVARADRAGLPLSEQLRAESLPDGPARSFEEHVRYVFEVLGGTRQATPADADRFSPELAADMGSAGFDGYADLIVADVGPVRFVRFAERSPESALIRAVAGGGTPIQLSIAVDDIERQIDGFTLDADRRDPRRVPAWQLVLVLVAASALIAAAGAAWMYRAGTEAWLLGAAAVVVLAFPLMLRDSSGLYTVGRAVPGFAVVLATAILTGRAVGRARHLVLGTAVASGLAAAAAVFVLDATPIGHPEVFGALTDNESLYRALMAVAGVLTGAAMGGVAAINIRQIALTTGQMRQALWANVAVAGMWGIAALGSALDISTGDGTLASGVFAAVTWTALAAVPAVTVLRILVTQWGRPELAALVINLESEDGDLQPAIARALNDPSLQVLTSPDDERLVDRDGHEVAVDELTDDRALTRIQSGGQLIGGLVHDAGLKRDPDRLEAVAAAAGMALQVGQLNRRIADQLAEVDASRARILAASDMARRQIERDLHDGAQQRLVAHGLRLQRARRLATTGQEEELVALLEAATRDVREVINDIRAVSRGAQPALLAERGLAPAVDALAERAPVPIELAISTGELPPPAERAAFYVIAEGLTNMAKHASATRASVSIADHNGDAQVIISDNGQGGAEIAPGSGLEGLNDRIAAIGGSFNISSGPDGTTLEATIPCG